MGHYKSDTGFLLPFRRPSRNTSRVGEEGPDVPWALPSAPASPIEGFYGV
jgi:hypothetical protein